MRNEAYENAKITKNRVKVIHDKLIIKKTFVFRQKVLLYNFRLHLFSRKLKSRWTWPFIVRTMFTHGAVGIYDPKNENEFKVNGQCLKSFMESVLENKTTMGLFDPMYR